MSTALSRRLRGTSHLEQARATGLSLGYLRCPSDTACCSAASGLVCRGKGTANGVWSYWDYAPIHPTYPFTDNSKADLAMS